MKHTVLSLFVMSCIVGALLSASVSIQNGMQDGTDEHRRPASALPPTLLLTFLGDIMAHKPNFEMTDYGRIYAPLQDWLANDDLTFANLETPVDPQRAYYTWPRFNVQLEYVRAAIEGNIEVFSLANNHATDWHRQGVVNTLNALDTLQREAFRRNAAIWYDGLRPTAQQRFGVQAIHRNGWNIGFVSVTQFLNDPWNGAELVRLIDYRDETQAQAFLDWIGIVSQAYDLFVVSYHAGNEYQTSPETRKAQFFDALVEAGADVVWGHHPHVLQPWRIIEFDNGRRGVVIYSLGNFVSGQTWFLGPEDAEHPRAFTGDSLLLRVIVRMSQHDGYGAEIAAIDPIYITHYKAPEGGVVVRLLDDVIHAGDVPSQWRSYYRRRRQILGSRFGNPSVVEQERE